MGFDMEVPEYIFRAYDIRGISGKDINPEIIAKCSAIFANIISEWGGDTVSVSGDVRLSTPSFIHAAIGGILSTGLDVICYYPLPIPTFNFSLWMDRGIHGGAYITASHNPPDYNGIRFRRSDGTGFSQENQEIKKRFFENKIRYSSWRNFGSVSYRTNMEVIDRYVDFALEKAPTPDRKLRIVIDGKFGASNLVSPMLFGRIHDLILVNGIIDGSFPGGMPDPLHGDVSHIRHVTTRINASLGISFDGDGDRAAFFDENGRIIPAEFIGLFLAENLLKAGDTIVYNVMCSSIIKRKAEEMGFRTVECRVGDVFVAEKARQVNAKLCVEESYHFFIPLLGFYYDDSILTALFVANILSNTNMNASKIVENYGQIYVLRENIPVRDDIKFRVIDLFREWAENNYPEVSTLDGVKIYMENMSFLARPSNTEPLIRIVAEGDNMEKVRTLLSDLKKKLVEIIGRAQ